VYAGVLTPKGKFIADLRAYKKGADVMLELDATAKAGLLEHLKKSVPPLFARFEDVSATYAVLGVYGPNAGSCIRAIDENMPEALADDEIAELNIGSAIGTHYSGTSGVDLVVSREQADDVLERLIAAGAQPASLDTLEVLRIEAGQPRWGAELDEGVIPIEAGLRARMISETKGCYTGQEVIIRILHRGHVNRHLRGLRFGATHIVAGTALFNEAGKEIGKVTSVTWSPRFDQYIGLGYVRREIEPPAAVRAGDSGTAEVIALNE
jgi:folate-binding protein YgfZ